MYSKLDMVKNARCQSADRALAKYCERLVIVTPDLLRKSTPEIVVVTPDLLSKSTPEG